MSVEKGSVGKVDNPGSILPATVHVSVPSGTSKVVQSSALGMSYGSPGGASAASTLLRNVKQDVESEEEGKKKKGKGGGKREKGAKFVDANKHLMKKGILELDPCVAKDSVSRLSDQQPGTSATLPPQHSPRSHPTDTCRPVSFYQSAAVPDTLVGRDSSGVQTGVLVAGAGGSMRMLENGTSPNEGRPFLYPGDLSGDQRWEEERARTISEQASSPDSGYGNTPDNVGTEQSSESSRMALKQHLAVSSGPSRSASERSSSSDSVTLTRDQAFSDHGASFCGGDMSLSQGGKIRVGLDSDADVQLPSIPTHAGSAVGNFADHRTPAEGMGPHKPHLFLTQSVATQNAPNTTEQPPLSADTPRRYDPFSRQFVQSLGPSEEAQRYHFPSLHHNPPGHEVSPLHSVSTVSMLERTSTQGGENQEARTRPRGRAYQLSPTSSQSEWTQGVKKRRKRSQSQPSLDSHQDVSSGQKDYFQVSDELSRENSHFALSEALLSIIEQYKANTTEAVQEAVRGERELGDGFEMEEESDSLYTDAAHFPPRSWGSTSSVATDDSEGFSVRRVPKISLLELMQCSNTSHSAESTAQRLLQYIATQYSGVDPEDLTATQTVLTLPADFLASLKQDEDLQKSVTTSSQPTRGSKDWAPPRAQLIFHIKHPSRKQLSSQGYRCTGCGMRQDPAQARYFRFCNYTGKYFCQKCHTNATSVIPAYVMDRWSFKKHYVSNFAHDLLERLHYEPVFDVQNMNPQVYSTVPVLAQARDVRTQLIAIKKYLKTCRRAQSLTATFDGYIPWTADVHTYSIDDFLQIKLKLRYLKSLLSDSIKHVKSCPLCQGKGFVCEFCSNPEIIYPFELNKVSICQHCLCCFHKHCFGNQPCPRCIRMRQRERRRRTRYAEEENKFSDEQHT